MQSTYIQIIGNFGGFLANKGKFIVFEGIDGSGKSTMLKETASWLGGKVGSNNVIVTAEPTKGELGKKIREILAFGKAEENAEELLELYVKDREEHLDKVVKPALGAGNIVLCDRYKYSTFAYQVAQGIEQGKVIELHSGFAVPDLAVVFDLPVEVALSRISNSARRGKLERFEAKEFLEKVRKNFLKCGEVFEGERIEVIDASVSKEKVREQLKNMFSKLID